MAVMEEEDFKCIGGQSLLDELEQGKRHDVRVDVSQHEVILKGARRGVSNRTRPLQARNVGGG